MKNTVIIYIIVLIAVVVPISALTFTPGAMVSARVNNSTGGSIILVIMDPDGEITKEVVNPGSASILLHDRVTYDFYANTPCGLRAGKWRPINNPSITLDCDNLPAENPLLSSAN